MRIFKDFYNGDKAADGAEIKVVGGESETFSEWLKNRPLLEKLDDWWIFFVYGFLGDIVFNIKALFLGKEWKEEMERPLCENPAFGNAFSKMFDALERNDFDEAEERLDFCGKIVGSGIRVVEK